VSFGKRGGVAAEQGIYIMLGVFYGAEYYDLLVL
jgi:hypothetical protein